MNSTLHHIRKIASIQCGSFCRQQKTNFLKKNTTLPYSTFSKCYPFARASSVKPVGAFSSGKLPFCRKCGHQMELLIPHGDNKERFVCKLCRFIDYQNPKMIVGCIPEHEDKILLCSRGIEPCKGLWTLPAGFLELGETTANGAIRETYEEANARVSIISMFSVFDIPVIGQTYIIFRAKLLEPFTHAPGYETLETKLFSPTDIPFDEIAFSSVSETLKVYLEDLKQENFRFHYGVISRRLDAVPNDPSSFKFQNHIIH